ncbi:hypothetical protein [Burkholderia phage BCSR5]|nr:hypothetical protein [Burkholderia phage BCSR5]
MYNRPFDPKKVKHGILRGEAEVLATFIFDTTWLRRRDRRGYRPSEIVSIGGRALMRAAGHNMNYGMASLRIGGMCSRLVRHGYMVVVKHLDIDHPKHGAYKCPVYAPTEAGIMLALSQFDVTDLPAPKQNGKRTVFQSHLFRQYILGPDDD